MTAKRPGTTTNLKARIATATANPVVNDLLVILGFVVLTILMTWPWVLHLRDGVSDPGDPYLNAWIMWWDYFQTFHDPVNLFHAPIFYPYKYTLAYSEHNYGIAMLFFPFYALGLKPLTAAGLATLLGFVISGYGAFRLARTLAGSTGVAWVAGIIFGFALYRFATISHLNYLFAGWIPLTLEAIVLFMRQPNWRRAAWLGVAFTMNALTCIHWFVLTLIPFAVSGAFLLTRFNRWTDRQMWKRMFVALALSGLVLLPFMLPYQRAAKLQGTVRRSEEAASFSAHPKDWLAATPMNKLWHGFGPVPDTGERHLFPGLLPVLLLLAAVFLARSTSGPESIEIDDHKKDKVYEANEPRSRRKLLIVLDVLAILALIVAVIAYGYGGIMPFGLKPFHVPDENRPLAVFFVVILVRLCLAYPQVLRIGSNRNLIETFQHCSETFGIGLLWTLLGFFGSLGMNFFFHRLLFEYVFIFRSIRVPARWAMMAMLGLALLAGLGARSFAHALHGWRPQLRVAMVYAVICGLLLFEARSAPMHVFSGEVDPDAVTLYLKKTPMRGGVAHLPSGVDAANHRYVLRQADHERPLITAFSGFVTPILKEFESLSQSRQIPDRFLSLLEEVPTSYLVVHDSALPGESRAATRDLLTRGITSGRLRFINSFPGTGINGNDGAELFAVTKTEPDAKTEGALPDYLVPRDFGAQVRNDPTTLVAEFERLGFPLYRFYKVAYGRLPTYLEFVDDAGLIGEGIVMFSMDWDQRLQENFKAYAEGRMARLELEKPYDGKSAEQRVDQLFANAGIKPDEAQRAALISERNSGASLASLALKVSANEQLIQRERNTALLLLHYFGYLRRNPGEPPDKDWEGFNYWRNELEKSGDISRVTRAFMVSGEYLEIRKKEKK